MQCCCMIDNYDSFTFNLVQYFGELGEDVRVFRNDEIDVDGIAALRPDALVLSPGPVHAGRGRRLRRRRSAHFAGKLPILGVCLGHQAIGAALGGKVVRAAAADARQDRRDQPPTAAASTPACRSSFTRDPLPLARDRARERCRARSRSPSTSRATARSWACATASWPARKTPLEGVQFHPESILTEHGHAMLQELPGAAVP